MVRIHSIKEVKDNSNDIMKKLERRQQKLGSFKGRHQREEQKRLLINNPKFLFLDEPTGILMMKCTVIQDLLLDLSKTKGIKLRIAATHDNKFIAF